MEKNMEPKTPAIIDLETGQVIADEETGKWTNWKEKDYANCDVFTERIVMTRAEIARGYVQWFDDVVGEQSKKVTEWISIATPDGRLLYVARKLPAEMTLRLNNQPGLGQFVKQATGLSRSKLLKAETYKTVLKVDHGIDLDDEETVELIQTGEITIPDGFIHKHSRQLLATRLLALAHAKPDEELVFQCQRGEFELYATSVVTHAYAQIHARYLVQMVENAMADRAQYKREVQPQRESFRDFGRGFVAEWSLPQKTLDIRHLGNNVTLQPRIRFVASDHGKGAVKLEAGLEVKKPSCGNLLTIFSPVLTTRLSHFKPKTQTMESARNEMVQIFQDGIDTILDVFTPIVEKQIKAAMEQKIDREKALLYLEHHLDYSSQFIERIREEWNNPLGGNGQNTRWSLASAMNWMIQKYGVTKKGSRKRGDWRPSWSFAERVHTDAGKILGKEDFLPEEIFITVPQ